MYCVKTTDIVLMHLEQLTPVKDLHTLYFAYKLKQQLEAINFPCLPSLDVVSH